MTKRERQRLERTAYHEAGRAVAAYVTHRRFKYVTIVPKGDYLGQVTCGSLGKGFAPGLGIGRNLRYIIEREVILNFAGHAAESMFTGKTCRCGPGGAFYSAFDLITYLIGGDEEIEPYLRWLRARSRGLVRRNWGYVEALAEALLKQHTINSREARTIIRDEFNRRMKERVLPEMSAKVKRKPTK